MIIVYSLSFECFLLLKQQKLKWSVTGEWLCFWVAIRKGTIPVLSIYYCITNWAYCTSNQKVYCLLIQDKFCIMWSYLQHFVNNFLSDDDVCSCCYRFYEILCDFVHVCKHEHVHTDSVLQICTSVILGCVLLLGHYTNTCSLLFLENLYCRFSVCVCVCERSVIDWVCNKDLCLNQSVLSLVGVLLFLA